MKGSRGSGFEILFDRPSALLARLERVVAVFHPREIDRRRERIRRNFFLAAKPVAAALDDSVEPTCRLLGCGLFDERLLAEEQPPVAEGFIRVGFIGGDEGLLEIDLVEVRGARVMI